MSTKKFINAVCKIYNFQQIMRSVVDDNKLPFFYDKGFLSLYGMTGLIESSLILFSGILGPKGCVVFWEFGLVPGMMPEFMTLGSMVRNAVSPA